MKTLQLLSGGAAQGLCDRLAGALTASGIRLSANFGAVGTMKDRLLAGEPCDVFISTEAMLRDLASQEIVDGASIRAIGHVATGIGARTGDAVPGVGDADALRRALLAAGEIHCPDTAKATAGIHFARVLAQLGIADAVASRLRTHPNGMTAMRAVAASSVAGALGCTQITEILATPGIAYAGDLPGTLALDTVYAAGVTRHSAQAGVGQALVALLSAPEQAALRSACGFR